MGVRMDELSASAFQALNDTNAAALLGVFFAYIADMAVGPKKPFGVFRVRIPGQCLVVRRDFAYLVRWRIITVCTYEGKSL